MARARKSEINKWFERIKANLKERQSKQPDWDKIYQYFRGTQWADFQTADGQLVIVNQTYSHVKVVVPSVYSRVPKIFYTALRPDTVERSRMNEMITNQDMERMKLRSINKRIVQDIVLYGTGFTKTYYDVEAGGIRDSSSEALSGLSERFKNVNPAALTNLKIPKNGPAARRVNPRNIGTAVGVTDFDDPGFVWERVLKRVGEVKRNPNYNKKATKYIQPTLSILQEFSGLGKEYWDWDKDEEFGLVELFEIWNPTTHERFVICDGCEDYVVEPEEHDYPVDHPYDKAVFTPLEDQIWGEGEIVPWINNNDELNLLRTMMSQHVKRFNRKYVINDTIQDEAEIEKLVLGLDGTVLRARGGADARAAIAPIQDAQLPADLYRYGALVKDDIIETGKINQLRRGSAQGIDTATEANIIENNANLADIDRIDEIGKLFLSQMDKVRKYRRAFTPGLNIVQMTGRLDDAQRWEVWRKEDIDILAEMRIEFGQGPIASENQRKNEAVMLYDRAVQNPTVNPQSAFVNLLRDFNKIDVTEWFLPPEIIRIQIQQKLLGAAQDQKGSAVLPGGGGIGPQGTPSAGEPGPAQSETPAEVSGRAAPSS